jgi:hypothetical protein
MQSTDIETPIFKPESYTDCSDRMTAELYQVVLDLRQEVHELRLAVLELNRQARRQYMRENDWK